MQAPSVLPGLRQELELIDGAAGVGGSPTWMVHDPVRNQYFEIDWISHALLRDWGAVSPQALLERVQARQEVQVSEADLAFLLDFLRRHQLLQPGSDGARQLTEQRQQMAGNAWSWLLHNYLFFRIPLVKPDRVLGRTQAWTDFIYTRGFAWATVLAGVLGLIGAGRQWHVFERTLVDFYSWQGLLAYGLTLAFVKVLHELGHAYTAKRMGCQVPTMGLAFLVLWPVLYTDTNDAWRLKSHRQRLAVSSAGVLTELGVALWATLLWVLVPDGGLRTMLFLLATTTWVSTVLINVSPFMRFDGYFILMDLLRFPNLHGRSFALARWHLRKVLLGLQDPAPEPFRPRAQRLLILFAWLTWLYRLVLFLGIAVLVYHFFIKLVGIVLFLVEIIWFVARPLAAEWRVWWERWGEVRASRRAVLGAALLVLLSVPSLAPLPGRVRVSAVVLPQNVQALYAPKNARLLSMAGADVGARDQNLFVFEAPQLHSQGEASRARQAAAQWQSGVASLSPDARGQWQSLTAQHAWVQAEGQLIRSDLNNYRLLAAHAGRLHVLDPELQAGQWTQNGEKLGYVIGAGGVRVVAYVQDVDLQRLQRGQRALFLPDSGAGPALRLQVDTIHTDRIRTLSEPELALNFGGSVPVREHRGQLFPEGAFYRIELIPETGTPIPANMDTFKWRGQLSIASSPEPLLAPWFRSALSVLVRETGF